MVEKTLNLLGKDVTVRKTDGTAVRGLCVNQFEKSIIVDPSNGASARRVVILTENISEILFEDFKPIKSLKDMIGGGING